MQALIRKAQKEDLADILSMVKELADFEKETDAVTATLEDYEKAFDSGLIYSHVACIDEKVVGMMLYYDAFSSWKGKMMYLDDFYVKPNYRSGGIGSMLLDALIEESKSRGCILIKWQVLDWNVDAIRFYKSKNAEIETTWYNSKLWL